MTIDLGSRPAPNASAPGAPVRGLRPPFDRRRQVAIVTVVACAAGTVWAWRHIGFGVGELFGGVGDIVSLLGRMLPPTFGDLGTTVDMAFETLFMAIIGTTLAIALSVPLAFGAARNTTPHGAVMALCRGVITLARAIPDVVFALVFVRGLGIGVLPGILALGLHSVGMVAKLFADAIENVDETPREAVVSTGATKWQAIVTSLLPQVMPSFIAVALYRLDINLRSSTVLGFVGAGGIGFLLQSKLRALNYDGALGIVVVVFCFVTAVEVLSALTRASLIGGERVVGLRSDPRGSVGAWLARRLGPRRLGRRPLARTAGPGEPSLRPPWTGERARKVGFAAVFAALLVVALVRVRLDPLELAGSLPDVWRTVTRMFPPDFTTARDGIIEGMLESLAIATVATFLGTLAAFPLGLLAARNVAVNRVAYVIARVFLIMVRGVPELIVAVVFVSAIGLGPTPGALALTVGTAGFFAKLIADVIEEVDRVPREAVTSTGASRVQETFTAVVPPAMPALVGNLFYVLDVNLRSSAILGIVGAGGIGTLLSNSTRVFELRTTGAIILSIFVVVYVIELLSGWLRTQLR